MTMSTAPKEFHLPDFTDRANVQIAAKMKTVDRVL